MRRALSYLLVSAGLVIVGAGVYSIWSARHGEEQAEEQREGQIARRTPKPKEPAVEVSKEVPLAGLSIDELESGWWAVKAAEKGNLKRGPATLIAPPLPGRKVTA